MLRPSLYCLCCPRHDILHDDSHMVGTANIKLPSASFNVFVDTVNCRNINGRQHQRSQKQLLIQKFIRDVYYFSFIPSLNALPTFSPRARYVWFTGSKVMGHSFSGSILPFAFNTRSSAHTLTISPTNRQDSSS